MRLHLDDAFKDNLFERSKNVHQSLHFSDIHDDLKVFITAQNNKAGANLFPKKTNKKIIDK